METFFSSVGDDRRRFATCMHRDGRKNLIYNQISIFVWNSDGRATESLKMPEKLAKKDQQASRNNIRLRLVQLYQKSNLRLYF